MKKLFLLLTIALCVASYSSPLSAKEDKNTEITIVGWDDTIICQKFILDKYGFENIVKAYNGEKVTKDSIIESERSMKIRTDTVRSSLIRQDNKVVEVVSPPIFGEWKYPDGFVIACVLFLALICLILLLSRW